eukprot:TRINITY_DN11790_c0_g2_i3.p1 TRINITY_DN11790_c0_g2~~TRINITY_DN11790_c0_g2_i3.p1  ORF type:complete len:218 (+),score=-4.16 TRINITY_DN11790_c0_g2_i3:175-828(+)
MSVCRSFWVVSGIFFVPVQTSAPIFKPTESKQAYYSLFRIFQFVQKIQWFPCNIKRQRAFKWIFPVCKRETRYTTLVISIISNKIIGTLKLFILASQFTLQAFEYVEPFTPSRCLGGMHHEGVKFVQIRRNTTCSGINDKQKKKNIIREIFPTYKKYLTLIEKKKQEKSLLKQKRQNLIALKFLVLRQLNVGLPQFLGSFWNFFCSRLNIRSNFQTY